MHSNWLLLIPLFLWAFIFYARSGKNCGGEVGKRIRNSDHWALEDAITEKKEQLREVCSRSYKLGSRSPIYLDLCDDIADLQNEIYQLEQLREKYPLSE